MLLIDMADSADEVVQFFSSTLNVGEDFVKKRLDALSGEERDALASALDKLAIDDIKEIKDSVKNKRTRSVILFFWCFLFYYLSFF